MSSERITTVFVAKKLKELGLEHDEETVELITEIYLDFVYDRSLDYDSGVFENDKIFEIALKKYRDNIKYYSNVIRTAKAYKKEHPNEEINTQDMIFDYQDREAEALVEGQMVNDRLLNNRGGYGYNDSYDDRGLDEITEDDTVGHEM